MSYSCFPINIRVKYKMNTSRTLWLCLLVTYRHQLYVVASCRRPFRMCVLFVGIDLGGAVCWLKQLYGYTNKYTVAGHCRPSENTVPSCSYSYNVFNICGVVWEVVVVEKLIRSSALGQNAPVCKLSWKYLKNSGQYVEFWRTDGQTSFKTWFWIDRYNKKSGFISSRAEQTYYTLVP